MYEAATRSEVKEKLAKGLHNQQLGINIAPERQTVAQFLNSWLEDVVKTGGKTKNIQNVLRSVQTAFDSEPRQTAACQAFT